MVGDEPLVYGEIRYAGQPDLARAPGLRGRPFDGVVEIDGFRERPRLALARRFSAAASINPHRRVALRYPPLRVDRLPIHKRVRLFLEVVRNNPQLVFLVWTQIQNRGKSAGAIGAKHVGLEPRAIAHRHVDVLFDDDAIGRRRRRGRVCFHKYPRRAPVRAAQSGSSTFTCSVTFFQYAISARLNACASASEALGVGLMTCLAKALVTGSDLSACSAAARIISRISCGVAAGA